MAIFPKSDLLVRLLTRQLPICRDAGAHIMACDLREVITGRRGKVFALAEATVLWGADDRVESKLLTLQRFADGDDQAEEGRKVYRRMRQRAREAGASSVMRPWAAFLRDERLLVLPFPFDYRLPQLVDACESSRAALRLGALLGESIGRCAATPVRYVPEKRCQIRFELGGSRTVYGKVTAEAHGEHLVSWMRTVHAELATGGIVQAPAPVGYVHEWHMLVQQAAPGRTVYDCQRDSVVPEALYARVGEGLASLHRIELQGLPAHTIDDELTLLSAMLRKQVLAEADQAEAERLLGRLRIAAVCLLPSETVTCHRDFHDKQLLTGIGGLWIIDLDTLARGPLPLDAGNFLAHLRLRHRQGFSTADAMRASAAAFIEGYEQWRPLDVEARYWWTAAALLRLAAVYAVRPAWTHLAPVLIADAWAALACTGLVPSRRQGQPREARPW